MYASAARSSGLPYGVFLMRLKTSSISDRADSSRNNSSSTTPPPGMKTLADSSAGRSAFNKRMAVNRFIVSTCAARNVRAIRLFPRHPRSRLDAHA